MLIAVIGPIVTLFTWANCNSFDFDEYVQILEITGGMVAGVWWLITKREKEHERSRSPAVDD